MSYNILTIPVFDKQLKRLSKKFSSLKKEFSDLLDKLETNPKQGKPLGRNCYKIRLAIASFQIKQFICSRFTINRKNQISQKKS